MDPLMQKCDYQNQGFEYLSGKDDEKMAKKAKTQK